MEAIKGAVSGTVALLNSKPPVRDASTIATTGFSARGDFMAKVKVRRTNREELPGVAVLRDSLAAGHSAYPSGRRVLDLDMEVDPDLQHLMSHDPDGFFTALDRDETLGFAACHVRSRQWILSELWVLGQHRGRGAGEALMSRCLTYGERSGAREYLAVVPTDPAIQSLLLLHGLQPVCPVYLFRVDRETAITLASTLSRLLPGQDVTNDLLKRRGHADLDRIDKLVRGVDRGVDHVYWLKRQRRRTAFVRQGSRIAAYAYAGADVVGPVSGTTQEAALAALGWALDMAVKSSRKDIFDLRVPAPFVPAIDALLEAGIQMTATLMIHGKKLTLATDRCVLGAAGLP